MNDAKCLSENELSEFVQGRIDADRVEEIAEHLEACGDCQATVVMLGEKSDTFVEQLRSPAVPDALEAENACQDAVDRLAARVTDWPSGSSATLPPVGEIEQIGPYRIQGQVGVGGMGTVYEAVHTKLKRTVALKILPASRWTNPLAIARFEREMEIIGQLDHPNIVRASDAGEENGMHYLVMEHVDGLDLSRLVNRVGPLAVADACEIARQAAIGLQYAHENHLVHRDIKPSNLMLSAGCRVPSVDQPVSALATSHSTPIIKILDLGLALLSEAHSAHENELTTVGQLMGTLDYMSPEQGMDSHEVDIRADIYSLGATLFKLLTGRAPFASPQYNTLLKKVTALANKPVTPIQQIRSDIPDELASIIDRMLAKEPADRFSTPNKVASALEPFARAADLSGLLAAALKANEPEPASLPPVIASRNVAPNPATSKKALRAGHGSRRWKLAGSLAAIIFLVFAAGLVIRIATDNGELVVSADDNAQVLVRKDGVTVKQLEVAKGEHAVTVRSGAYRIELKGKSDELVVSSDTVIVKRGERVVVRVEQRPKVAGGSKVMSEMYGMGSGEESDSGGEMEMYGGGISGMQAAYSTKPNPTYDGKTYTQWLAELQTERKPERLTDAIRAFASLGEGDEELAKQSATVIMKIMRRNGSNAIDDSPRGKLIGQAQEVLQQMPGEIAVSAIENEMRVGNTRSRSFANLLLRAGFFGWGSHVEFTAAVNRHRESIYQLLLTLPEDEAASIRADALALVISHANARNTELDQVVGLIPRLQVALKDKDLELVTVAANTLVDVDPENTDLVPALMRLVSSSNNMVALGNRLNAIRSLGQLGARSHAAVSQLVEIIRPIVEPDSKASSNLEGYGSYGGGMDGGMVGFGGMGGYDRNFDSKYMTIEALGRMGPAAKAALPLLRKIAESKATADSSDGEGEAVPGFGPGGGGGSEMGTSGPSYVAAAQTAIARIEGKEPIPTTSEEDNEASSATQSGGFF